MRILWLCNIMLPAIAKKLNLPYSNREGWLTGIYEKIIQETNSRIELGICFPVENMTEELKKVNGKIMLGEVSCYAFEERLSSPEIYDRNIDYRMIDILYDFAPDVVHIFGTEFPHTLAMVKGFDRPERTLIGIQGLCSACADAYMADIPEYVVERITLRDWLKKDSLFQQQEKFRTRGEYEKKAIALTGHITGRTTFDREETGKINPKARYHFMNETMRKPFYSGKWSIDQCEPYRIFLSQGDYPLKGFHYVLEAMPEILLKYPEACIYVAGNSIINNKTWKDKLKISSYGKYLQEIIKKNGLENKVRILGKLSAEEMKEQFLKSSVFICPSSLENSPNSMGEAMLLGVPVVASRVGGIPDMICEETEGLLYEPGNIEDLSETVMRVWEKPLETIKRSDKARIRAYKFHDGNRNYERLKEIYKEMCV